MVNAQKMRFSDPREAEALRSVCREEGIEVSARYQFRNGADVVCMTVDAPPEMLPDLRARARYAVAWGAYGCPTTAAEWRARFRWWLFGVWCHAGTADVANSAADLHDRDAATPYDLGEVLVWLHFVEYLSEFPERRKAWRAFLRQHGPCDAL